MQILFPDGSTQDIYAQKDMSIKNYESYNIPILYLAGSIKGMSKDNAVTLSYSCFDRTGTCTLKWQGNTSIGFPKKNYTIKFDNAFEVVTGWGAQKKYCLKANFNDCSHARNLMCAKIWGNIVKSRTTANTVLNALQNGGAVDGFPVIVSLNGKFHGLYTWNIPKDAWMFGMSDSTLNQAIVCADLADSGATLFKASADFVNDFELEYSSNDDATWVLNSLNRLINAVKDSDGTNITYGISPYIDWDSAIDYYIHTVLTNNSDATLKNYILATFDGVKWFFSAYDMDTSFGIGDYGKSYYNANSSPTFEYMASRHKLFELIWKYMRPQLRSRYNAIRNNAMSEIKIATEFYNFAAKIPLPVLIDDLALWKSTPMGNANNIEQMLYWYRLRVPASDEWIKSTSGETALPEQVNPNIPTLSSISATYTGGDVAVGTALTALTGITVKATYSDGSTSNVTGYTLSGEIKEGTNTITVTYEDKTTTFIVTGVAVATFTNRVPTSIDKDGSIYNGVGYKDGYRIGSDGGERSGASNGVAVGYIKVSPGNTVRVVSLDSMIRWSISNSTNCICYCNSAFTKVGHFTGTGTADGVCTADNSVVSEDEYGHRYSFTVPNDPSIEYVRLSIYCPNGPNGEDLIVTVNEEIP